MRTRRSLTGVEKEAQAARRCEKARLTMASLETKDEAVSGRERNEERMVVRHSLETGVQADISRARHQ